MGVSSGTGADRDDPRRAPGRIIAPPAPHRLPSRRLRNYGSSRQCAVRDPGCGPAAARAHAEDELAVSGCCVTGGAPATLAARRSSTANPGPVNSFDALAALDFGKVDSESEPDLDRRFVRTTDFDRFTSSDVALVVGAKGTGKSALFELFTKFARLAREISLDDLSDVIIAAGTGFTDLSEIATGDIERLKTESGYDHDRLWRLYIAIRAGLALKDLDIPPGPLRDLMRAVGSVSDLRVGPLLRQLWRMAVGEPPSEVSITAHGATLNLRGGKRTLDVVTLLEDIQRTLARANQTLWLLFDKIDEIFPTDRAERTRALSGLMSASMSIRRTFPSIQPRILLRTDIWRDLDFTNKSHLVDKTVELSWSKNQLAWLLLKRACAADQVKRYVAASVPGVQARIEDLTVADRDAALGLIFPETVYPGEREAAILDWITARVTDGQGTALAPRDHPALQHGDGDSVGIGRGSGAETSPIARGSEGGIPPGVADAMRHIPCRISRSQGPFPTL